MYVCIFRQHFFVNENFIKHNRHFISTYFLLDPFEFPYYFYRIRGELIYVLSIVVCIPSTFCPTLGHHQGRIYYKSDVTFVLAYNYCLRASLPLKIMAFAFKWNSIISASSWRHSSTLALVWKLIKFKFNGSFYFVSGVVLSYEIDNDFSWYFSLSFMSIRGHIKRNLLTWKKKESVCDVMANMLDCDIRVNEFEPQSRYYAVVKLSLGNVWPSLFPHQVGGGWIVPLLFFYKACFGIK